MCHGVLSVFASLVLLKEREKGEKPYFHSYIFTYN